MSDVAMQAAWFTPGFNAFVCDVNAAFHTCKQHMRATHASNTSKHIRCKNLREKMRRISQSTLRLGSVRNVELYSEDYVHSCDSPPLVIQAVHRTTLCVLARRTLHTWTSTSQAICLPLAKVVDSGQA